MLTKWKKAVIILYAMLRSYASLAFSAYTNDELDQLEREFIQQVNSSERVVRVPLASDYINHIGKLLAEHGDLKQPYFFIVNSNEINAFAGPGGYIGLNTQLILTSDTESELAAVMAHELAHVRQHHLYRLLEHQKQMRVPMLASLLASIALGAINPILSTGALMGSLSGFAQDNINFVRSNEKEADSIGIDMLTQSGFDPHGMGGFFKKMQESARYRYDNVPSILRTHPLDEERIAEAESRADTAHISGAYPEQFHYQLFKELIRNSVNTDHKQLLDYYKYLCGHPNQLSMEKSACHYGYTLSLMANNQYDKALQQLMPLLAADPNNLYYRIAQAHLYQEQAKPQQAVDVLKNLYTNFPDSYALLSEYSDALIAANQPQNAIKILLIGNRQFKNDLPLCKRLARAEAASHKIGYAYFVWAECHLLQGEQHDALRQLKHAKTFAQHDRVLQAKIAAKMDAIIQDSSPATQ